MIDYFFATYDLFSPVPNHESLIINNTNLSAEQVAQQIIEQYDLANTKGSS